MKPFVDIALAHRGLPVVAMGGGPSLPDQVAAIRHPVGAWVSANEHGAKLRQVDYIVAVDDVHQVTGELMGPRLRAYGVPLISPRFFADYRMPAITVRRRDGQMIDFRGNSGMQAIWVAWALGGWPVIVAGIDNYQGGTYWHTPEADSSGTAKAQDDFDDRLAQLRDLIGTDRVRVVDGPLLRFWPKYDPGEVFPPEVYSPPPAISALPAQTYGYYRVLRNLRINRGTVLRGDEIWITADEAGKHLRRGHLLPLQAPDQGAVP